MDNQNFWHPIAISVAVLFVLSVVALVRSLARSRIVAASAEEAAEMSALPMTPPQKRAWWALSVGVMMAVAAVAVIAHASPAVYFDDGDLRLVVLAFVMVVLLTHLAVLLPLRRGRDALDERDRQVLSRAPQFQAAASLITVAAWSFALTESFRGEVGVPRDYMYLIFWSVFVVQTIAHSAGILVGYWFVRHHAEG